MNLGPLMIDLSGTTVRTDEIALLRQPLVGGVILFKRNYQSPPQLIELVKKIRQINPQLLLAVDHEGGRVQRFRNGFTTLPPMAMFGNRYQQSPQQALILATECGWLLAAELLACDLDFSFTPVLDLDLAISDVIGDRAFSSQPDQVAVLAQALISGLQQAGMAAVGKHFPGHGAVAIDSHHGIPHCDWRESSTALAQALIPFERLIAGGLSAIMPAHIVFDHLDGNPPCFSRYWLQQWLRQRLRFTGAIFSDDLMMKGAEAVGDIVARSQLALDSGCDMILICNDRPAVEQVIARLQDSRLPQSQSRLTAMRRQTHYEWGALQKEQRYQRAVDALVAE
ncbi:MAG: beta-N-acetylhexosaminidase [Gammaproteobacteria bacterium]|nr:beta-N-acetylhexosaminidase [Gammaproteobacteria bacterium]